MAVLGGAAPAEQIPVKHLQRPMHRFMVARLENGKDIATGEFTQVVQGNQVTMRMTYRFVDGSIDDETTTYVQQGTFRLLQDHHIEKGPFFSRPIDFTVDAVNGIATSRTPERNGGIRVENRHIKMPKELSNGIVGTLLLNVPRNTTPFRVEMLAPVGGGRLIHLLISSEGEQTVNLSGQTFPATVFRIHPELGGIVGLIARLIGLQPKDVKVWILEGEDPAVAVIVGQLGGYGPVVSSDLVGASFRQ
jgi:hypothetical protein